MDLHEANQRLAGGGDKAGPVTPQASQFGAAQTQEIADHKKTIEEQKAKIEELQAKLEEKEKALAEKEKACQELEQKLKEAEQVSRRLSCLETNAYVGTETEFPSGTEISMGDYIGCIKFKVAVMSNVQLNLISNMH